MQLQILYLLKHDSIVIIYTSSFRKYKKRVIVSSLDMFPQSEIWKIGEIEILDIL